MREGGACVVREVLQGIWRGVGGKERCNEGWREIDEVGVCDGKGARVVRFFIYLQRIRKGIQTATDFSFRTLLGNSDSCL